jgi:hypothetical protein
MRRPAKLWYETTAALDGACRFPQITEAAIHTRRGGVRPAAFAKVTLMDLIS